MAHKKAGGSAKNLKDSGPQYLGLKIHDGENENNGKSSIRKRGKHYLPGTGVDMGRDYTIFAIEEGVVKFTEKRKKSYDGQMKIKKVVSVIV